MYFSVRTHFTEQDFESAILQNLSASVSLLSDLAYKNQKIQKYHSLWQISCYFQPKFSGEGMKSVMIRLSDIIHYC